MSNTKYIDVSGIDMMDDVDPEEVVLTIPSEISRIPISQLRRKYEKREELLKKDYFKNASGINLCQECGAEAIDYFDKILKFYININHNLTLESRKQQTTNRQSLNSSPVSPKPNKYSKDTLLNNLRKDIKIVKDELIQIKNMMNENSIECNEVTESITQDCEDVNKIQRRIDNNKEENFNNLSVAYQSYSEIGFLSGNMSTIKILYNITEIESTFQSYNESSMPSLSLHSQSKPLITNRSYSINGFLLSFAPITLNQSWSEINAAWSCVASMSLCLRNRGGFQNMVTNHFDSKKALYKSETCEIMGIRVIPLRERPVVALIGHEMKEPSNQRNSSNQVFKTIALEGFFPENQKKFDIMSSALKSYRQAIVAMSLFVATTIVQINQGYTSKLPQALLDIYVAAQEEKLDFGVDTEEWDTWIPLLGSNKDIANSDNPYYHFENLSLLQFNTLISCVASVLKDIA